VIDQIEGLRPSQLDLTHMTDIEYTNGGANGVVLVEYAGILDRHVPAAEIYHSCAQAPVHAVEGSALEDRRGLNHRSHIFAQQTGSGPMFCDLRRRQEMFARLGKFCLRYSGYFPYGL
jgi:hypothetical protein